MLAEAPMYEPRQGSAFMLLDYSADNATFVEIGPQTPIVRRSSENGGLAETTRRLECERAKAQKPPSADVAHVKKSDRDAKTGDGLTGKRTTVGRDEEDSMAVKEFVLLQIPVETGPVIVVGS
ncbi:hypothetical protein OPV22_016246 [Ensete ventricosum]|uniref:Uncharacterized protein n=1 Tax=Ensete ventricosum TaxID=4639 RepID=A0AAV8PDV6_ENSVE|nr:hypothetical protein OPV22_016246 [Ensete ventricosum]